MSKQNSALGPRKVRSGTELNFNIHVVLASF